MLPHKAFIFVHGWGANPSFWDPLRPYFADYPCLFWDLGYFGQGSTPLPPNNTPYTWVGVGHSLGLVHLLDKAPMLSTLIGIQSAPNFLGQDLVLYARQRKLLGRLTRQFEKNSVEALQAFYKRCAWDSVPADFYSVRLAKDLDYLLQDYLPSIQGKRLMVMGSFDDPIVPVALLQENFPSNIPLYWRADGMHALGKKYPAWVASQIKNFLGIAHD